MDRICENCVYLFEARNLNPGWMGCKRTNCGTYKTLTCPKFEPKEGKPTP